LEGRTHAVVGVASAMACSLALPCLWPDGYGGLTFCIGASVVGALFADLDISNSKGSGVLRSVLCAVVPAAVFLSVAGMAGWGGFWALCRKAVPWAVLLGVAVFAGLRPHREFSHSFFSLAVASACVFFGAGGSLWAWFSVGYLSHLLADLLNYRGESLLWPFGGKFCLGLCSSDGAVSRALFYLCSAVCMVVFLLKEGGMFG